MVGYAETGLRFGAKGAGASFVKVGSPTSPIDLQDISIVSEEEEVVGTVSAQKLDNAGRTLEVYFWYDVPGEYYGWFNENDELAEGVTVLPGEGLYFDAPDATYRVQSAGEVPTTGIAVQLRFGAKHVVNPTPVPVNLNDEDPTKMVTITSGEEEIVGTVSAQKLDNAGRTSEVYFWYDIPGEYYGWFDEGDNFVEGVVMQPGESLYFDAPDNTYYVNFPGVEL